MNLRIDMLSIKFFMHLSYYISAIYRYLYKIVDFMLSDTDIEFFIIKIYYCINP